MSRPAEAELLTGADVTLNLLVALSTLTPTERADWIDSYLVGRAGRKSHAQRANRKLRAYFVSPDQLKEAC